VVDVSKPAKRVKSRRIRYFLENYLYRIEHCNDENTLIHYYCAEPPYSLVIECTHYEGTSTEDLALLLAGLIDLEKTLRAEAHIELLDRATEIIRVKLYSVFKTFCRGAGPEGNLFRDRG
jgi:hypothetical protein